MKILAVFIFLIAPLAHAGTNFVGCFASTGEKVLSLQTLSGPTVVNGELLRQAPLLPSLPLENIRDIARGVIVAESGDLKIIFLGYIERAILITEDGSIAAELTCKGTLEP